MFHRAGIKIQLVLLTIYAVNLILEQLKLNICVDFIFTSVLVCTTLILQCSLTT